MFITLEGSEGSGKKLHIPRLVVYLRGHFGDFHWDDLDIDIEVGALKRPEQYLLKFE